MQVKASAASVDTDRVWIDDSKAKTCAMCAKHFTTFNRRHHCRNCGCVQG